MILLAFVTFLTAAELPKIDPSQMVKNEKGESIPLSSLKNENDILVLVFVATSCPATNLYWQRFKGIWYNHREHGISMTLIGGNSDDSIPALTQKLKDHDL